MSLATTVVSRDTFSATVTSAKMTWREAEVLPEVGEMAEMVAEAMAEAMGKESSG